MPRNIVTPKQKETLDFLRGYIARYGQAPTVLKIAQELRLSSLRSVAQRLEALERKGLIKRDKFKQRSIVLTETNPYSPLGTVQVPVIASAGCDTADVFAQERYQEFLSVEQKMIDPRKTIVAIKAVGGSMIDAGIHNGDYVLVEVTDHVASGDRVVALLGEMAVIKRLQKERGMIILHPEASGYNPIVISEESSRIFGKVLSVIPGSAHLGDTYFEYDPGFNKNI